MSPLVLVGMGVLAVGAASVSATTGVAGGLILLSGLLFIAPASAVVPLHGAVQLTANISRIALFRQHIRRDVVMPFALGLVPGSAIGVAILFWIASLSEGLLKALIAVAILASLASPKGKARDAESERGPWLLVGGGIVCGTLGILVGSTGPVVSQLLLRQGVLKEEHVASKALMQGVHNLMKLPIFGLAISFDYGAYGWPLVVMAVGVVVGTWVGKRVLAEVSSGRFVLIARALLFLVAAEILVEQAARAF